MDVFLNAQQMNASQSFQDWNIILNTDVLCVALKYKAMRSERMKVLKRGDLKRKEYNTNPIYRFECNTCGCVFECVANECRHYFSMNAPSTMHKCPTCGVSVWYKYINMRRGR